MQSAKVKIEKIWGDGEVKNHVVYSLALKQPLCELISE